MIKPRKNKKTTAQFIEEAQKIHSNRYDYSLVQYGGAHNKVKITCSKHGVFEQTPNTHLKGAGCRFCGAELRGRNQTLYNTDIFIEKAKNIHGDLYDYSLVDYKSSNKKVKIICHKHGIFEQIAYEHYSGAKCPKCYGKQRSRLEYIEMFKEVHEDRYDYSLVKDANRHSKIPIICKIHGLFYQTQDDHIGGHGCDKCGLNKNSNELKLLNILKSSLDTEVCHQMRFNWLGRMSIDIFIPEINLGIEYQGLQHFKSIAFFGGDLTFKERQKLDKRKMNLCIENNIELIYVSFDKRIPDDYQYKVFSEIDELLLFIKSKTSLVRGLAQPVP